MSLAELRPLAYGQPLIKATEQRGQRTTDDIKKREREKEREKGRGGEKGRETSYGDIQKTAVSHLHQKKKNASTSLSSQQAERLNEIKMVRADRLRPNRRRDRKRQNEGEREREKKRIITVLWWKTNVCVCVMSEGDVARPTSPDFALKLNFHLPSLNYHKSTV